jgi:transcriptional antiterminator Rof (Rho-off)
MTDSKADTTALNPDELEVAPGTHHEDLEGWIPALASDSEVREALEKAFDYRGDVTLTLKSGERLEAYIFDRKTGSTLADSYVRLFPVNSNEKVQVAYREIARLEFTGKDRAAGKHWEDWVTKYNEKKARGEKNIGLHPESLD